MNRTDHFNTVSNVLANLWVTADQTVDTRAATGWFPHMGRWDSWTQSPSLCVKNKHNKHAICIAHLNYIG